MKNSLNHWLNECVWREGQWSRLLSLSCLLGFCMSFIMIVMGCIVSMVTVRSFEDRPMQPSHIESLLATLILATLTVVASYVLLWLRDNRGSCSASNSHIELVTEMPTPTLTEPHGLKIFRWFVPRRCREDIDIIINDIGADGLEMQAAGEHWTAIWAMKTWQSGIAILRILQEHLGTHVRKFWPVASIKNRSGGQGAGFGGDGA